MTPPLHGINRRGHRKRELNPTLTREFTGLEVGRFRGTEGGLGLVLMNLEKVKSQYEDLLLQECGLIGEAGLRRGKRWAEKCAGAADGLQHIFDNATALRRQTQIFDTSIQGAGFAV